MLRRRGRNASERKTDDLINAPMVEIFGGSFALLLILFILIDIVANTEIYAMLETSSDQASYKVTWENQSEGFVVVVFPDRVQILETNQSIPRSQICAPAGDFLQYAAKLYGGKEIKQMIFAIVEQAVDTMAIARDCLYSSFSGRMLSIGWIIANRDLLNAVDLNEIPAEIKRAVTDSIRP